MPGGLARHHQLGVTTLTPWLSPPCSPGLTTQAVGSSPHTPGLAARLPSFEFHFFSFNHLIPAFSISAGWQEIQPRSFLQFLLYPGILSVPGHPRVAPCPISYCQVLCCHGNLWTPDPGAPPGPGTQWPPSYTKESEIIDQEPYSHHLKGIPFSSWE